MLIIPHVKTPLRSLPSNVLLISLPPRTPDVLARLFDVTITKTITDTLTDTHVCLILAIANPRLITFIGICWLLYFGEEDLRCHEGVH